MKAILAESLWSCPEVQSIYCYIKEIKIRVSALLGETCSVFFLAKPAVSTIHISWMIDKKAGYRHDAWTTSIKC